MRCPLINDVSREQVERGFHIAQAFGVNQPILSLSAEALGLVEKLPEVLACRLSISRLVGATDDDVQAGPTLLTKIAAPPSEKRVQLFEFDANSQVRSLEGVRGQCANVFMKALEVHDAFLKNSVHKRACATKQLARRLRCNGKH